MKRPERSSRSTQSVRPDARGGSVATVARIDEAQLKWVRKDTIESATEIYIGPRSFHPLVSALPTSKDDPAQETSIDEGKSPPSALPYYYAEQSKEEGASLH